MILDLHSHSVKLGTFFYTNFSEGMNEEIKIFPMMVCKNDQRFDYRSNRYRGGSTKTARKVLFDILKIPKIYTVESSYYGYQKIGDHRIIQYVPNDYREMGENILISFSQLMKKRQRNNTNIRALLIQDE